MRECARSSKAQAIACPAHGASPAGMLGSCTPLPVARCPLPASASLARSRGCSLLPALLPAAASPGTTAPRGLPALCRPPLRRPSIGILPAASLRHEAFVSGRWLIVSTWLAAALPELQRGRRPGGERRWVHSSAPRRCRRWAEGCRLPAAPSSRRSCIPGRGLGRGRCGHRDGTCQRRARGRGTGHAAAHRGWRKERRGLG